MTRLVILSVLLISLGCSEEPSTSSLPTARVVGYATYESDINYVADTVTSDAGIKVELEGTNFAAITDPSGRWEIQGIPIGTYTVRFSKNGYYTFRAFNNTFFENGTNYLTHTALYDDRISLVPIPTYLHASGLKFNGTIDSIYTNFTFQCSCDTIFPNNPFEGVGIIPTVFFSKDSLFDPMRTYEYLPQYDDGNRYIVGGATLECTVALYTFNFQSYGFRSGDTVYCAGFVGTGTLEFYYYDFSARRSVDIGYSTNHTQILKFIVP